VVAEKEVITYKMMRERAKEDEIVKENKVIKNKRPYRTGVVVTVVITQQTTKTL